MGTVTDTLVERVDELIHLTERPLAWGNPLVSTTPTAVAIRDLAMRIEALEEVVLVLAVEVQRLSHDE